MIELRYVSTRVKVSLTHSRPTLSKSFPGIGPHEGLVFRWLDTVLASIWFCQLDPKLARLGHEICPIALSRTHRYPPEIIGHAVWLYYRFGISLRDVEDLLAERGITVSYETIRRWCTKFGLDYAKRLKRRQGRLGDTWFLDEVFVTINGERQYLWRAVDQDSDVIDILVQSRRNRRAAERFFRKLLKGQRKVPFRLVTDKLKSYGAALRTIMPSVNHDTERYANNRAEVSHQPTRQRERQMRRFKSPRQSQLFLSVHGVVLNLFRVGRHRLKSDHHRMLRERSFETWNVVTAG